MRPSLLAALFALVWSTGFVVARGIAPLADPNLFLAARFGLAGAVLGGLALLARSSWPMGRAAWFHLGLGGLFQGLYLGAGYWAVGQGLPAGVMALFGALQPLLTAFLAPFFFGERISSRVWGGLAIGAAGVALVVGAGLGLSRLEAWGGPAAAPSGQSCLAGPSEGGGPTGPAEPADTTGSAESIHSIGQINPTSPVNWAEAVDSADSLGHGLPAVLPGWLVTLAALSGVLAVTVGTMLQKARLGGGDPRSAGCLQNLGAAAVALCLAGLLGERRFAWSLELASLTAYAGVVLSAGGATLLAFLARSGEVTRAAALVLVAPPLAAVEAWLLFGETLTPLELAGFALALGGVLLARRR